MEICTLLDAHNIICWRLGDTRWKHIAGNLNGLNGITQTQFNWPWDVTLDPMGNVYVVDTSNHRLVRKVEDFIEMS